MVKLQKKPPIFQIVALSLLVIMLGLFFVVGNKKLAKEETSVPMQSQTPSQNVETQTITVEPTDTAALMWPLNQSIQVSILMYHHIGPLPDNADDIRKGLTVSENNFDLQMKYLKQNNYNVVTMRDLYTLEARNSVPDKTVVLTFDDGYQDNYLYAEPILADNGFKATFNIITGMVGTNDGSNQYMTQEELVALDKMGHELASHTLNHLDLAQLTGAKLQTQLVDSKNYLEKLTGKPIVTLCYPSGKFSPEVEQDAQTDGYKMALTTEASKGTLLTSMPFEIPRYRINPTTSLSSILK